jgi:radical SAM superfamily enzyme YgiQ (UPF0313 family)
VDDAFRPLRRLARGISGRGRTERAASELGFATAQELYYSPGVLSVAARLLAHGVSVEYVSLADVDEHRVPMRALDDAIERADLLAMNAYTANVHRAAEVCAHAKQVRPGIRTVLGGNHASGADVDTLARHPDVDVVVRGEGEDTLLDLVQQGGDPSSVAGTTFRADGRIHRNACRPRMTGDRIPIPAYELLPFPLSRYLVCLSTQRGCVNACPFCAEGGPIGSPTYRSLESIAHELRFLSERLPPGSRVFVADSVFVSDPGRARSICAMLARLDTGWTLGCNLYASVTDPATLDALDAAGFSFYFVGFESASPAVLDTVHRSVRGAAFFDNVKMCREIRRRTSALVRSNWVVGLPGSTWETVRDDIAAIEWLLGEGLVDAAVIKNLIPYPETLLHRHAGRYGIEILTTDWARYSRGELPVYRTPQLSQWEIYRARVTAQLAADSAVAGRGERARPA